MPATNEVESFSLAIYQVRVSPPFYSVSWAQLSALLTFEEEESFAQEFVCVVGVQRPLRTSEVRRSGQPHARRRRKTTTLKCTDNRTTDEAMDACMQVARAVGKTQRAHRDGCQHAKNRWQFVGSVQDINPVEINTVFWLRSPPSEGRSIHNSQSNAQASRRRDSVLPYPP